MGDFTTQPSIAEGIATQKIYEESDWAILVWIVCFIPRNTVINYPLPWGTWLAQWVECATLELGVVSSSRMLSVETLKQKHLFWKITHYQRPLQAKESDCLMIAAALYTWCVHFVWISSYPVRSGSLCPCWWSLVISHMSTATPGLQRRVIIELFKDGDPPFNALAREVSSGSSQDVVDGLHKINQVYTLSLWIPASTCCQENWRLNFINIRPPSNAKFSQWIK